MPAPVIFFPIDDSDGSRRLLALDWMPKADLENLGHELWIGARGAALQGELSLRFGGALPKMSPEGRFKKWDRLSMGMLGWEGVAARIAELPALSGMDLPTLVRWARRAGSGSFDPRLVEALDSAGGAKERLAAGAIFGKVQGSILDQPMPLVRDIVPHHKGGGKAEMPWAVGEESAALVARQAAKAVEFYGAQAACNFYRHVSFAKSYLHHEGRWMVPMLPDWTGEKGNRLSFRGKAAHAVWIPLSQAIAIHPSCMPGPKDLHRARDSSPEDLADLLALSRAAPPAHFFLGEPIMRAWTDSVELAASAAPAPALPRRSLAL